MAGGHSLPWHRCVVSPPALLPGLPHQFLVVEGTISVSSWARCPPAAAAVPPAAPHALWHCHRERTQGSQCTHGVAVEHPRSAWASRGTATQSPGVLSPIGCPRMSLSGACPRAPNSCRCLVLRVSGCWGTWSHSCLYPRGCQSHGCP